MGLPTYGFATTLALHASGARTAHLALDGVALRYYVHAARNGLGVRRAAPWLFLHGLGSTAFSWWPILRRLPARRPWLVPELSALGGTRAAAAGLSIADGARTAAALLEHAGAAPATVIGSSLGGWMAIRLALAHPEKVSRLILIGAAGYLDQDWEGVARLVTPRRPHDVTAFTEALFFRRPWYEPAVRRSLFAILRAPAVTEVVGQLGPEDVYDDAELAGITAPTLVLWGERDGLFPPAVGRRIAAAMPDARFELIAGAAHACQWEKPADLVRRMEAFATE